VLQLHGGRIAARSAGLGHGTEFIVVLPLAHRRRSAVSSTIDPATSVPAHPGQCSRVLIVDDNSDAADTLALLARHWGHDVATARDGPSALELAQRFLPQHALVDIGLPGMDGYELGRRLREQHEDLYLVAMTGYGRKQDREATYAASFDSHLVKPPDLEELRGVLANGGARKSND
jgi:CheY-like chemotaxis protein